MENEIEFHIKDFISKLLIRFTEKKTCLAEKTHPFMRERTKMSYFYFLSLFYFVKKGGVLLMAKGTKLERDFQSNLIKELKKIFVGCLVMKLDSSYIQGIPDLLILYKNKWATLECKKSASASKRPNQEYYVGLMNKMSFSRFICPENKEEVLHELKQTFNSN